MIISNENINIEVYERIFIEFVEQLDDIQLSQGYFQSDGVASSSVPMVLITGFFGVCIIGSVAIFQTSDLLIFIFRVS